ncbi:hypothetical protein [uncultured Roseibium sp.]|uniref:hypothetical protein n=1 Tax=uncultured Roseibium sp. TaxID=1936171 RepID=UPI0026126F80|nr:hypothetical protein [uncultured Roseibium sp.]
MRDIISKLLIAAGLAVGSWSAAIAQDASGGNPTSFQSDHGWKFNADIYGWLPQINLETIRRDEMELPLWQILQNLNFTAMAGLTAQNGRWTGFSDFIYMNLQGTRTSTANIIGRSVETGVGIKMQALINTTAVGYSVLQTDNTELKAFAGTRYLWLKSDLSFNIGRAGGEVVGQGHVWDGIVGLRGQTNFADRYFVTYYGDVGTGQSDLTWQALGGLGYRFDRFDAVVGWRYLDWNFSDTAKMDDLTVNGPFAGIKVHF